MISPSKHNRLPAKSSIIEICRNDKPVPNGKGEYSLKQNCFDPSKSSPPNEFMLKLYMMMNINDMTQQKEI